VFIIIASAVLLSFLIAWNRARQADATAARLMTQKATIARGEIILFVRPIMSQLGLIQALGRLGLLDPSGDRFQRLWPPLMASVDQVDRATLLNSEGSRTELTRTGSKWETRSSEQDGTEQNLSWFRGALEAGDRDRIYWDGPTTDGVNEDAGLTASIAWTRAGETARSNLAAFHIAPEQVEHFIRELPIGETGEVFLLGDPGIVVHFSLALDGYVELTPRDNFFSGGASYEETPVLGWLMQPDNTATQQEPFRFSHDGEIWWAVASPLTMDETTTWIGLALTEDALLADLQQEQQLLAYVLLAVLAAGVISLVFLARQYGGALQKIRERPKFSDASEEAILALIRQGEQERVELKSTLRWNLKSNKSGPEIAKAWLKTLVAFLNTDGGTLFIGVGDDGEILGIDADRFANEDKYLLHFNNLIKQHVGLEQAAHLSVAIRSVEGKSILVVDSEKSADPVFLRFGDDEEFFIRVGSGTRRLPTSKVLEYVEKRASA
jgi:hypothetical protein